MFGLTATTVAAIGVGIGAVGMAGNAQSSRIQGAASKKGAEESTKQSKAKPLAVKLSPAMWRAL